MRGLGVVDHWNRERPVGIEVLWFRRQKPRRDPVRTVTTSQAWVEGTGWKNRAKIRIAASAEPVTLATLLVVRGEEETNEGPATFRKLLAPCGDKAKAPVVIIASTLFERMGFSAGHPYVVQQKPGALEVLPLARISANSGPFTERIQIAGFSSTTQRTVLRVNPRELAHIHATWGDLVIAEGSDGLIRITKYAGPTPEGWMGHKGGPE